MKVIKFWGKRFLYGVDSSYSLLKNYYNQDPNNTRDDNFSESSNSAQLNQSILVGFQGKKWGIKTNYIFYSRYSNESSFSPISGENTYKGSGFGVSLTRRFKKKSIIFIEYQAVELTELSVNGAELELPTTTSGVSLNSFSTTSISGGLSYIF